LAGTHFTVPRRVEGWVDLGRRLSRPGRRLSRPGGRLSRPGKH